MTLGIRKVVVVSAVGAVFLLANVILLAHWMQKMGWIEWARNVRSEFLTGTTITIIVVLLVLLVNPIGQRAGFFRRCSVCNRVLVGRGSYCSECGSKQ